MNNIKNKIINSPNKKRKIIYPNAKPLTPLSDSSSEFIKNNKNYTEDKFLEPIESNNSNKNNLSKFEIAINKQFKDDESCEIDMNKIYNLNNRIKKENEKERINIDDFFVRSILKTTDPFLPPVTSIPKSLIPSNLYVTNASPLFFKNSRPIKNNLSKNVHFENVLFPSSIPEGRDQVTLLNSTLQLMLKKTYKVMADITNKLKDPNTNQQYYIIIYSELLYNFNYDIIYNEFKLWNIVLREICRQVYVTCDSRGILLERVRARFETLIQLSSHFFTTLKIGYKEVVDKYHDCLYELSKDPAEKERERLSREKAERDKRIEEIDSINSLYNAGKMKDYYTQKNRYLTKKDNIFKEIAIMEDSLKKKNRNGCDGDYNLLNNQFHIMDTYISGLIKARDDVNTLIKPIQANNNIEEFLSQIEENEYDPVSYIKLISTRIERNKNNELNEDIIEIIRLDQKLLSDITDRKYKNENELRDYISNEYGIYNILLGSRYLIDLDDFQKIIEKEIKENQLKCDVNIGNLVSV